MRYHLFQKFCGKMVKIKETSFSTVRSVFNPQDKGLHLAFGAEFCPNSVNSPVFELSREVPI